MTGIDFPDDAILVCLPHVANLIQQVRLILLKGGARKRAIKAQNMKIKINIGGKTLIAILADNATARDFASVLPLTVSMKDLFGREKYGDLPKALSENGPRKNRNEVGEIAYWSPDRQFAIYYRQDGETIPSPGIIPIAKIDAGTEVFNVPGSVKVMIEIAK